MTRFIVPPYLLAHLAAADTDRFVRAPEAARQGLLQIDEVRAARSEAPPVRRGAVARGPEVERTISDAQGTEHLPGVLVRGEGEPAGDDVAVTEAYDALGATHALFLEAYGRSSIDGAGLPLDATVHYGQDYDNAFWNGERMVFGDGDGEVFRRFTASVSVIGHELAHGVTQYTANLEYQGQSGALNESVSDVFGALVEQHLFDQTAEQATWLIGEGLFTEAVEGRALRSMSAPGTAYDDDVLGKDPQPAHMDDYVETTDDNGGVHLNSGIPNRAFFLVADALGGRAWERAGQVWYDTLVGGLVSTTASFAEFAAATVSAAAARYGEDSEEARATTAGWQGVGVEPAA
ncbi:M4 family metallopeptidase [Frigoribacterium sp. PvP032]|uniref:M4 family metallopeptidase n=1 Tax=Frigoribacterium sp. PvP032 TaxID=2806589 RepID=UPI001AE57A87|nr:M4 family metallopeptidase [Frigoribacterium sp. PvP032]MBP1191188.1 Zn-dependent metalloprotease [Frigoribacterium sp. PvP032]